MLRITSYADRLLEGLDKLEWPDKVKKMQANWIGRSEGAEIDFPLIGSFTGNISIKVFTTRADTIYGVTYLVLAPEHKIISIITTKQQKAAVEAYIAASMRKSNIERMMSVKEKTGVFTGSYARNPANNEPIPVWISDFILADYGTGAIMAVPAHDSRDRDFAIRFGLPEKQVISSCDGIYTKSVVNYKLRDWIFSRQRYWGEPIPIIHCDKCGEVPVPEKDLPVRLPYVEKYEPSGTGQSPLALMNDWINTNCPACGGAAKRETDTMPQWAGSSWYFLRYCDPNNQKKLCDRHKADKWLPVDLYIGGNEHAILHLLYARFYTKFLYDIGTVSFDEPFKCLYNIGMINKDGYKMSKSKPNCVSSDEIVQKYGADTLRLYEMFIGPPDMDSDWNDNGIEGIYRFLKKVWNIAATSVNNVVPEELDVLKETDILVKEVTERLENNRVNTVISLFMSYANDIGRQHPEGISINSLRKFIIMIAPFAPHFAEEIWEKAGDSNSIFKSGKWPECDQTIIQDITVKIPVQVNGRKRGVIVIGADDPECEVIKKATSSDAVKKYLDDRIIIKILYVPQKVMNIITD